MKAVFHFLILCLPALMLVTCTDKSSGPGDQGVWASLKQVGGCGGTSLAKASPADSCFSYRFTDTLAVDFCVTANCCPDTNRFALSYQIRSDTIFVAVSDTAARLCRCMCGYTLHGEFGGLPLNDYQFVCFLAGDSTVLYSQPVSRIGVVHVFSF